MGAVPTAQLRELRGEVPERGKPEPLAGNEPLDATAMPGTLAGEEREFAMEVAPVLHRVRRDVHGMPAAAIPGRGAELEREERGDVEAVGLGPAFATIDLDARRIDHGVYDPTRSEGTMESEAIAAGFVAGGDRSVRRQVEVIFGAGNLPIERGKVAGRTHAPARRVPGGCGEREVPAAVAEIEGKV